MATNVRPSSKANGTSSNGRTRPIELCTGVEIYAVDLHAYTNVALRLALLILIASFGLGMYRLLSGPSLPDRVIALDFMAFVVIAVIATYAIYSGQPAFLNVAVALALVAFLGTIAFARYIERLSRGASEAESRG